MGTRMQQIEPVWVLLGMMVLGALAGVGAHLRQNPKSKKPTRREYLCEALNSALLAVAMCALVFWRYGTGEIWLAVVLSVLSGLGGNRAIGLVLSIFEQQVRRIFNLDPPEGD